MFNSLKNAVKENRIVINRIIELAAANTPIINSIPIINSTQAEAARVLLKTDIDSIPTSKQEEAETTAKDAATDNYGGSHAGGKRIPTKKRRPTKRRRPTQRRR